MCAAITGVTPEYGLLLEQNRAGDVLIQVEADVDSEYDYELLGYITPKKMGQAYHCPVFNGLSKQTTSEQLMDLGTQLNIHGIVPMFHVVGVTPEAADVHTAFLGRKDPPVVTITNEDLAQARAEISAGTGKADFCILGCPHLTINQVGSIAKMLDGQQLAGQLYIFTSTSTKELAQRMGYLDIIHKAGGEIVINSCVDQPCWSHLYGMSGVTESPKCAYYTKRWNMTFTVKSIPACIQSVMKDERLLKGEPIASGIVEGEILVSKDPINFYMVSPEKGTIIEQDHALTDKVIAKKIIVFPIDKGSSVVQMDGLYQMSKFDNKPAGFIVLDLSTVLVSNAIIMDIPLIRVDQQTYDKFCEGQRVKMDGDSGEITILA